jgi:hypothetical protein
MWERGVMQVDEEGMAVELRPLILAHIKPQGKGCRCAWGRVFNIAAVPLPAHSQSALFSSYFHIRSSILPVWPRPMQDRSLRLGGKEVLVSTQHRMLAC